MKLKIGDVVEFKNWEYMEDNESKYFVGGFSPRSGKIAEIRNNGSFLVEDRKHVFNQKSIARVISNEDDVDISSLKPGDEVWVKTTVNVCYDDTVFINHVERFAKKYNLKKVKNEEPDCFIVKEDRYDLYIGATRDLVSSKDRAKIYESRDDANIDAADMQINAWEVIPYDD